MTSCILLPAYNEAATIEKILKDIKVKGIDAIVVDDGSKDGTGDIAEHCGAKVIRHYANLGKGASIKEGFNFFLEKTDHDAIIIMDADGQHLVDDCDNFIQKASDKQEMIIVGNRMGYTKNMPLLRLATNKFMSFLLSLLCKQDIPDTQCGFRLLTRGVVKKLSIKSSNFDTESEMLIDASRKGVKISSVPIKTIYGDETSQIHPMKDTIRFFVLILKSIFTKK
jgi:glycosyltransferase involved in cell wall biosynthesis